MSLNLKIGIAFTNLGRAFHPIYSHHRRVLWLMLLSGIIISANEIYQGETLLQTVAAGLNAALAGFVTWAVTRELDPDREGLSLLVIPLITFVILFLGPIAILPSALFIGTSRFLIRIVGLPVKPHEAIFLWLLPLTMMVWYSNPIFGLLVFLTFGAEAYFEKFPRRETIFAIAALSATLGYVLLAGLPPFYLPSINILVATVTISIMLLWKILRLKPLQSRTDFNDLPISLKRFQATLAIALIIALVTLLTGDAGFSLLAPLWLAIFVAAL